MNENEFANLKPITAAGTSGETYNDFSEYKKAFDTVLLNTANNFVRIGYLLKYARDTDILAESGHDSLVDFAKAEYGLDKTQVSRFIAINDRFSKGGYGDTLEDKYAGFGYAKLSVMLTLPEQITEDLAPEMTKAEITDLKKEVDVELQITDIEVALEEKEDVVNEITETGLVIRELVKSYPKLYKSLHGIFASDNKTKLPDELAPNGKDLYVVRVAGVGKFTVTADKTAGLSIVNMRSLEKTALCWKETSDEMQKWINVGMGAAASWENFFGTKLDDNEKPPVDNKKPVIDNKTVETDNKTAKNDKKPQKTDENSTKPSKTEEKKSRIHKPEEPKTEKKAEEPAPKEEAPAVVTCHATEEQVEELKKIMSEPAAAFMPEPGEEPQIIGKLEVAPVQQPEIDSHRVIEVREEVNLGKYGIDKKANPEDRAEAAKKALLEQARVLEHFFADGVNLMRNVQNEEGAYEEFCDKLFERLSCEMHEFTLLNRYLNNCLDESEDAFCEWLEKQKEDKNE